MGDLRKDFQKDIAKLIGTKNTELIFNGVKKIFFDIPGLEETVNFNDFVSENLAKKYVGNNGNAIVIASNYNPESVLIRTEIPVLLEKESVKSINGIPKEALIEYRNTFYDVTNDISANQKLVAVISGVSEDCLNDVKVISLDKSQYDEFVKECSDESLSKISSKFYGEQTVIVDTSSWLDNTDEFIYVLGNDADLDEELKNYIIKKNKNSMFKNTEGLNDFISFHENKIFDTGDGSSKIYVFIFCLMYFSVNEVYYRKY